MLPPAQEGAAGQGVPAAPGNRAVPRREHRGFDPSRLTGGQRPEPVVPRIVGNVPPRPAPPPPAPTPLVPPGTPAQRALDEARPHAEPKGFTDVRIVGVGGGGGNAVTRMIEAGVSGVEFIAVNTDAQALEQSQATRTIRIGSPGARRLGAGGDPAIGQKAAEETESDLADAVAGADMVFITAGMGGGTGTGAAPVLARLARKHGALTVGVVTTPFRFEGARRMQAAQAGIDRLREAVDALIVIPNDRLLSMVDKNMSVVHAFRLADDMLRHGVQGIADLVTVTGLINLDFADVRSIMQEAGSALMAMGEGNGPERARLAAEAVIASPLLEHSITGANRILLNVTGGPDLTLFEVSEVAEYVTQAISPEANIIFGAVIHPRPEAELRVTLIATGMPDAAVPAAQARTAPRTAAPLTERREAPESPRDARDIRDTREAAPRSGGSDFLRTYARDPRESRDGRDARGGYERRDPRPSRDAVQLPDDADPLDVPPFLRRQR